MSESKSESKAPCKSKISLIPYLYFEGNASEAIDWYCKHFDGKPVKMTYGQGPPGGKEEHKDKIMHGCITFGDTTIMVSDVLGDDAKKVGDNVELCINHEDVGEMTKIFDALSEGGKIKMPLASQFWGATYGQFEDKFGIHWAFNCHTAEHHAAKKSKTEETP